MGDHDKWFVSGEFINYYRFEIMIMNSLPDQEEIDATMGPALEWCEEQFGRGQSARWFYTVGLIHFYSQTDAAAFKLRWC
ncbi:MAG: hypothetical protein EOP83_06540 [Verrucomicrobiaceae bacterium]|nr:MAG: hypothetical protein EOP83_06540 [Verrucomicrobiaceae bacterium]